jgi:N-acetylmuramoyl-L-alanine amidase
MKNQIFNFIITVLIFMIATISFVGCEGKTSSSGSPSASPLGQFVVCLDPGHPSENNDGAIIQNGLTEVAVNWQVAKRLRELLKVQGFAVIMTKNTQDQYVDNKTRAQIANQAKSHLFLRLHCDSANGRVQGITFYYPDKQGTKDGKTGPPKAIISKSAQASFIIHAKTMEKLGRSLKDRGIKGESDTLIGGSPQGALTASIYSEVPVITVEMVFLDNPSDAEFIRNVNNQQKMAEALKEGIMAYFSP